MKPTYCSRTNTFMIDITSNNDIIISQYQGDSQVGGGCTPVVNHNKPIVN